MKICFIIDGLRFGGKERQLSQIVKGLAENQYQVYLITFKKTDAYSDVFDKYTKDIIVIQRRFKKDLSPVKKIYNLCRYYKFNIIHTFDTLSTFFVVLPAKLTRTILIDGSIRDAGTVHGFGLLFKRINLWFSNYQIGNSLAGLQYYNVKHGYVLYNAIDTDRFVKNVCKRKIVIMNASFSDYKDHKTFFKGVQTFVDSGKIDEVRLIGDGKHKTFWENTVLGWKNSEKYKFYGYVDDVEKLLSNASIGVLCSTKRYSEGISNSILEYMGAGLIAIASDIGGTSEIIETGKNGFLFEGENAENLKSLLADVLQNKIEVKYLKQNALDTLSVKFSYRKNIQGLISYYQKIIDEKKNKKLSF